MPYSPLLVKPMRDELTAIGFEELTTTESVDSWLAEKNGTAFLVVNSVCGCAAGMARPGARLALERAAAKPARLATVFAGQDVDATARVREFLADVPPSSPSMALLKDGELVHFVPRHRIEGRDADALAADLAAAFDQHCTA